MNLHCITLSSLYHVITVLSTLLEGEIIVILELIQLGQLQEFLKPLRKFTFTIWFLYTYSWNQNLYKLGFR